MSPSDPGFLGGYVCPLASLLVAIEADFLLVAWVIATEFRHAVLAGRGAAEGASRKRSPLLARDFVGIECLLAGAADPCAHLSHRPS